MWYKYEIISISVGIRIGGIKFLDKKKIGIIGGQKTHSEYFYQIISLCQSSRKTQIEIKYPQKRKIKMRFYYRGDIPDVIKVIESSGIFSLVTVHSLERIYQ